MTEQKWILYQTTNLVNEKIYVGVHRLQNTTRSRNYLGSGNAILKAVKKYGKENFVRKTLAEFTCLEDAYTAEAKIVTQEFASRLDTYNICIGGNGGGIQTPEMRAKISTTSKGRIHNETTRAKIGAAHKGRTLSDEHKTKLAISHKGKECAPETRAKMSVAQKGKITSEETKAKMSAANPNKLAVMINGKFYISMGEAAREEVIKNSTLQLRVKSKNIKFTEYRFATEKEKLDYFSRSTISTEEILDLPK